MRVNTSLLAPRLGSPGAAQAHELWASGTKCWPGSTRTPSTALTCAEVRTVQASGLPRLPAAAAPPVAGGKSAAAAMRAVILTESIQAIPCGGWKSYALHGIRARRCTAAAPERGWFTAAPCRPPEWRTNLIGFTVTAALPAEDGWHGPAHAPVHRTHGYVRVDGMASLRAPRSASGQRADCAGRAGPDRPHWRGTRPARTLDTHAAGHLRRHRAHPV